MAENLKKPASAVTPAPAPATEPEKPKKLNLKKILIYGVPLGAVQLVLLYLIIARFTGSASANKPDGLNSEQTSEKTDVSDQKARNSSVADSNFVYVVKDIIVNPAGTNGSRFLLTTIGLEVSSPEMLADLERKEVQVRDALITILSSKSLGELDRIVERDSLRVEIGQKISPFVRDGVLRNVYFSKFIIQ